ncbi:c-type cytochrome [Nitrincola schmidtii]|uniref:c-type cytochrome n=1 Tax=Nitrincola schmidtii TaxID=1730894 RepID=UPI001456EF02|nr:c-type cytochrome [Nitrincola schmidtii]
MKIYPWLTLAAVMFLISGCDREPSPKNMTRGDQLYAYYCQECHTYQGLGAQLQNLPPGVNQLQVHDVVLIIKHGAQLGHPMGRFPGLSDQQAFTVAEYAVAMRRQERERQLQGSD